MKRLAIFAHFDAQNKIKQYIVHHLHALRGLCERVVFVSTSKLDEGELDKVRPYTDEAWTKENVGLDFAMWRQAFEREGLFEGKLARFDWVWLTNSSCFGPIQPLEPVVDTMERRDADVWAMTENEEHSSHLQSYFLAFNRRAVASEAFLEFWRGVLGYRDKLQVIRSYELGLTIYLRERGLRTSAFAEVRSLPLPIWTRRRGGNPTCRYAIPLIHAGMPYVKVELLRDNPMRIPLGPVYRAMARSGYDMDLVEFDRPVRLRLDLVPTLLRARSPGK